MGKIHAYVLLLCAAVIFTACSKDKDNEGPAPMVLNVLVTSGNTLKVSFSKPLEKASASLAAKYNVNNEIGIPDRVEIIDSTATLTFKKNFTTADYTITFRDIRDRNGMVIKEGTTFSFSYTAPILVQEVNNLKIADSLVVNGAASLTTPFNPAIYWYFNLETGKEVHAKEALTDKWDLGYSPNPLNPWVPNAGSFYEEGRYPGSGGTGKGGMIVVAEEFDKVTTVPGNADFAPAGALPMAAAEMEGTEPLGWFPFEGVFTGIAKPLASRTIILRTANGKYAKLEIKSIYKQAPAEPTADSEKGYLTFRYFLQKDGSKNLNTK